MASQSKTSGLGRRRAGLERGQPVLARPQGGGDGERVARRRSARRPSPAGPGSATWPSVRQGAVAWPLRDGWKSGTTRSNISE